MSSIDVSETSLTIHLSPVERVFGVLRDQVVPRSAVTGVEVVPDGLSAVRGIRAPGLGLPGRRMIGTWRGRGAKTARSAHQGV